jgi:hypothetical protein
MTYPAPDTLHLFSNPAYQPPDHNDVRAVADLLGYTGDQLATVVGAKDGRAVRRWLAPPTAKSHAQIDYAAWRLLLLEAGLVRQPKPRKPRKRLETS